MGRSLGDLVVSEVGVISTPEVTAYESTDDDKMLLIASDGLWEFLSSQAVADLAAALPTLAPSLVCKALVRRAAELWRAEEGDYRDDTTVVALSLPILGR